MLSKDKTSFVLYTSFYDALQDLPLDRKGMLLDLIFNYEIHGDTDAFEEHFKDLPNDVKMAFRFIKGQLDKDQEKWRDVCSKRAAAGRKSGVVRAAQQNEQKSGPAKLDNFVGDKGTKRTNVHFVEQTGTKRTDNEYDNEYDDVVDTTSAHARTTPPTHKKIESYRKTLANKFYIKGEDDAFCRMVLNQARTYDQKKIEEMANGVPRRYTVEGREIWEWSQRVDVAVGYRVWVERVVKAWDEGKYKVAA